MGTVEVLLLLVGAILVGVSVRTALKEFLQRPNIGVSAQGSDALKNLVSNLLSERVVLKGMTFFLI